MSEVKFFNPAQFFTLRAFLVTFFGAGLIAVTEFVLPWLGILQNEMILTWITPVTITFSIAIILIASTLAKNIVSSILLAAAGDFAFWNPYSTIDYGAWFVIITYFVLAFFSGMFSAVEMSGRTAILVIGIFSGIQGMIGAGTSLYASYLGAQTTFQNNGIPIAHGMLDGTAVFDIIVAALSFVFMLVLIILSRRRKAVEHENKKWEIIGQILILIGIVGALVFNIVAHVTFDNTTAISIFGEKNTQFLNQLFSKTVSGTFMATTLLNIFYVLPLAGFVIALGLWCITHHRAEGTTGFFRFNYEGPFFVLNLAPFIVICILSFPFQNWVGASSYFYLETEAWFSVFAEFTNLLLINLLIVYLIFKIITIFRIITKK